MTDDLRTRLAAADCNGADDPRQRCGLHHCTELAMMGGYSCCCGAYWTSKNECQTGARKGDAVGLEARLEAMLEYTVSDAPADMGAHVEGVLTVVSPVLEQLRAEAVVLRSDLDRANGEFAALREALAEAGGLR